MKNWNERVFDASSTAYIERLYDDYISDPNSVPENWRNWFRALDNGSAESNGHSPRSPHISHAELQRELVRNVKFEPRRFATGTASTSGWGTKQSAVLDLINAYRLHGHLRADTDPLHLRQMRKQDLHIEELEPDHYGLDDSDFGRLFHTGSVPAPNRLPLKEILDVLQDTYCSTIGVEYMHIADSRQKEWLQSRIETSRNTPDFSVDKRKNILGLMTAAEGLERYLHIKYSGQKRFGLEGGESLIPGIDALVQAAGASGVKDIVLGMAHRGRLNVLVNIMGKQPNSLFDEFEKGSILLGDKMTGDVKYHQGWSSDVQTVGGPVHLSLAFNPSHLEIINPVVVGSARARMDHQGDLTGSTVLPLVMHGDAAIAGQGVVYETLQMSRLRGFQTGGSIHIVINNQIGFTTSHPDDSRSSVYCTDVGKVVDCPIFHVNGNDPEAVVFCTEMALAFRMQFKTDVFIDLRCYRRHGHNEADLPDATQPKMYKRIKAIQSPLALYRDKLLQDGVVSEKEAGDMADEYRNALDKGDEYVSSNLLADYTSSYKQRWSPYMKGHWSDEVKTGMRKDSLKRLGKLCCITPKGFQVHPSVKRILDDRLEMSQEKTPLDWGFAETLAYATLLKEGYPVRITGQDSRRGTFYHRHATIHDQETGDTHTPLRHLDPEQAEFWAIDSVLSEEAVLGFEYGYTTAAPHSLTVWEAQYGDFVNGAQVVIDQFISSSAQKWNIFTGLVMMLPHGWEGQGPEHSSARLERFLQLCAAENMQVCVPSTPAQMFHMLRRQMLRKVRLPLIIMSPKSMLRKKASFSSMDDLARGHFQLVIGEQDKKVDPKKVRRICLCSGRVYYTLAEARKTQRIRRVALIRIEQMYPFPLDILEAELARYPNLKEVVWVQEEPKNQGAWYQITHWLKRAIPQHVKLLFSGRITSSAPAGGSKARHDKREQLLIDFALGSGDEDYSTPF